MAFESEQNADRYDQCESDAVYELQAVEASQSSSRQAETDAGTVDPETGELLAARTGDGEPVRAGSR